MSNASPASGPADFEGGLTLVEQPVADAGRLPAPMSPLVGRERETEAVQKLLLRDGVRMVTLTGPGGVGKTRLALDVATALDGEFGGVGFVSLAPIRAADLVPSAMARSLGIREDGTQPLDTLLRTRLQDEHLLLVFDNFEHVDAAAPMIPSLLAACPRISVLVTSRAPLRVSGEHEYPVPPLRVPDTPVRPAVADLARTEAVTLFCQRAQAVHPDFVLREANADAIAEICRRLDGLPLAIELAAAWIKVLSPRDLLVRLTNRLQMLTGGPRDLPARLQTIRDAITWSYDLLNEEEQALFRRLSVFVGGFTFDAAEWVMGDGVSVMGNDEAPSPITHHPSRSSVLDGLASLVDKSLLRRIDQDESEPRFGMLETIREYGLARLEASGEDEPVRRQHAAYILALVEQEERPPSLGERCRWLDRVEAAQANLRAALAWGLDHDVELALRLAGALWPFWSARGHLSEGRRWLERALDRGGAATAPARLQALYGAIRLAATQGDAERAVAHAEESLTLATAVGDRRSAGRALDQLATVAMLQGDYARARALYAEALAIAQAVADKPGLARVWHGLGVVEGRQGKYDRATAHSEAALALYRELGDHVYVALNLQNLGLWADYGGDRAGAASRYAEALALNRELEFKVGIGRALTKLGNLFARSGNGARAIEHYAEALPIQRDHGDRPEAAEALMGLGVVAAERGKAEQAARLFGAATALGEAAGYALHPPLQVWHDAALAAVRAALGDACFGVAWDAGRALSLEQAVAGALAVMADPMPAACQTPFSLTPREIEVLRLMAAGRSDREIAAALFISYRTVNHHAARILAKLGAHTRAAAVRIALDMGIAGGPPDT